MHYEYQRVGVFSGESGALPVGAIVDIDLQADQYESHWRGPVLPKAIGFYAAVSILRSYRLCVGLYCINHNTYYIIYLGKVP